MPRNSMKPKEKSRETLSGFIQYPRRTCVPKRFHYRRLVKNLGTTGFSTPRGSGSSIWNLSIDEAEDYIPDEDVTDNKQQPKKRV